jgi:C-methyltransferase C-terminal domain
MSDEGGLADVADYYDREYFSLLECADTNDRYDLDADPARFGAFLRERRQNPGVLAIYGAGMFGSYLAPQFGAARPAITCFLDQNPFKVGPAHMGRPIVHPRQIPPAVTDVLVGLSPGRAREILAHAELLGRPGLRFFLP